MKDLTPNQALVLAAYAYEGSRRGVEERTGLTAHAVSKAHNGLKQGGWLTKTDNVPKGIQAAFDAALATAEKGHA